MCGAVDLQAALPLPSLSRRLRITTITAHPQGQRNAIACWVACRLLRRSSIGAALSTAERTGEELQAQLGRAAARHAAPEVLPELYAPPTCQHRRPARTMPTRAPLLILRGGDEARRWEALQRKRGGARGGAGVHTGSGGRAIPVPHCGGRARASYCLCGPARSAVSPLATVAHACTCMWALASWLA